MTCWHRSKIFQCYFIPSFFRRINTAIIWFRPPRLKSSEWLDGCPSPSSKLWLWNRKRHKQWLWYADVYVKGILSFIHLLKCRQFYRQFIPSALMVVRYNRWYIFNGIMNDIIVILYGTCIREIFFCDCDRSWINCSLLILLCTV